MIRSKRAWLSINRRHWTLQSPPKLWHINLFCIWSNLWQARASVVSFVRVADNSDYYNMIEMSCSNLIKREERFSKTSVGWILREISKHESKLVKQFIERNLSHFSIESLRNALKYSSNDERNHYLDLFKSR